MAIIAKLQERQATLLPGAWLIGQGTYLQPMPSREDLDEAFPDNPVDIRWSGHDHIINHTAAITLGLTKDTPDPGGRGRFERLPDGEVYICRDVDVGLPTQEFASGQTKEAVRGVLEDFYLRNGVTTVHDMSPSPALRAYQELRAEGRLPTRLVVSFSAAPGDPKFIVPSGLHTGFGDDWIRIGGVKIMLDGVWGTTAYTYEPHEKYSAAEGWAPNNYGGAALSQAELDARILAAHEAGSQVYVHALGDRAQDMVLDAFERAQQAHFRPDARLRIEHFGHAFVQDPERTADRLARMKRLGVVPACHVAMMWRVTDTVLMEKDVKFFPMKTIIDAGFHPPGGADTLGTQNFATNPLFTIGRAVNRDSKHGITVHPEEAISVVDAIRMFTSWAAEGTLIEKSRGTIEVGKLADFVILSGDPLRVDPKTIESLEADMTILGGSVAYTRR